MSRRILDRYQAAGGSLLAGGLAYAALFAIVPAAILLAGVVGLVYADPIDRADAVGFIVGVLPPMRDLIETVLTEAARDAGPVSLIGAAALIWGASRFVVAFEHAIAGVTGSERRRGAVTRNLAGLIAVIVMVLAIPGAALLSGIGGFLEVGATLGLLQVAGAAVTVALGLLPLAATVGATVLVYRMVPPSRPTWGAVIVPGISVGVALTIVAQLFGLLAPRLIGAAALIGTLATAFAALAWLALSFQAILIGAAWVRDRTDAG